MKKIFSYSSSEIVTGFFFGAFLTVWPAIAYFKLLRFPYYKYKILILARYLLYIVIVVSVAYGTDKLIFLSVSGKEIYYLDNSGIGIIISFMLVVIAPLIDYIITDICHVNLEKKHLDIYRDEVSFMLDNLDLNIEYVGNKYQYEIEKYSKQNNINPKLILTLLALENIYRGEKLFQILEKLYFKIFYEKAIKKDMSLGVSQMKISTISKTLQVSPHSFKRKIYTSKFSIRVMCKYIKKILEEFSEENDKDIYEYISEKYVGSTVSKSGKIYAAVLRNYLKREELNK
ncbi:hypothetical protein [Cetobacterium ceti]|uniref:hypothetical protein n=1 Tax=Cetobacterium ceti TaxID=180163 RepID=UPI00117846B6|nr:hypothetical protein [Cetobacterium ceti]